MGASGDVLLSSEFPADCTVADVKEAIYTKADGCGFVVDVLFGTRLLEECDLLAPLQAGDDVVMLSVVNKVCPACKGAGAIQGMGPCACEPLVCEYGTGCFSLYECHFCGESARSVSARQPMSPQGPAETVCPACEGAGAIQGMGPCACDLVCEYGTGCFSLYELILSVSMGRAVSLFVRVPLLWGKRKVIKPASHFSGRARSRGYYLSRSPSFTLAIALPNTTTSMEKS